MIIPMHAVKPPSPDSGHRRPLVLVVEDSKIAQRVVEHVLTSIKCDVVFADNGESGIRQAASKFVDLILMDLQMPGMDGFATSRAIRSLPGGHNIPILALTANYSDEHRALCRQIGMQGFLSKPIQREELVAAVEAHLPAA
jgi:CheY-like chemotaxis protein